MNLMDNYTTRNITSLRLKVIRILSVVFKNIMENYGMETFDHSIGYMFEIKCMNNISQKSLENAFIGTVNVISIIKYGFLL